MKTQALRRTRDRHPIQTHTESRVIYYVKMVCYIARHRTYRRNFWFLRYRGSCGKYREGPLLHLPGTVRYFSLYRTQTINVTRAA